MRKVSLSMDNVNLMAVISCYIEWNVRVCVCEWVFAGECMCMSLFKFAYLGFEEEWDYFFILGGFFFQYLGYFY